MATYLEDPLFTLSDDKETVEFMELIHSVGKIFAPVPSVSGIQYAEVKGLSEGLQTGESFSISFQSVFGAYAIGRVDACLPENLPKTSQKKKNGKGFIHRNILPPSPEKRQRRHDSHGTH